MVVFSQIIAAIGYGEYFPWSVPALFSGVSGEGVVLNFGSVLVVAVTGLVGFLSTLTWWLFADQH